MNFLTAPVMYVLMGIAAAAGITAGVQTLRLSHEQTAHANTKRQNADTLAHLAELTAQTAVAVSNRERAIRGMLDSSNTAREEGIAHAVEAQQDFVAGVRDGRIKLHDYWTPHCPAAAAVPGGAGDQPATDDDADLRAASAGRIIRAGDDADIQVRGLQAYARACQALTEPLP
jgi:hypothetical protein